MADVQPGAANLSPRRLISLEDSPGILQYVSPTCGTPLWPLIRWDVLDGLLQWSWGAGEVGLTNRRVKRRVRGSHLVRSTTRTAAGLLRGRDASLLVVGGTAVRSVEREGRIFNPLTDYFVEVTPSARAMEVPDLESGKSRPGVLDQYPLRVAARLAGRMHRREHLAAADGLVRWLRRRVREVLGVEVPDDLMARWTTQAAAWSASLPAYDALWASVLRRLDVRLVVKIDGSYGGSENVALLRAAARAGVLVAEHQHGVVNRAHMAYNHAPAILDSPAYTATLPPAVLTYGTWWHDAFQVPSRLVALGHPHREAMTAAAHAGNERDRLLVLGNAIDTAETLDFCLELAAAVHPHLIVSFRPHPGEREHSRELTRSVDGRVHLDLAPDLYESLGLAQVVISEASTGLYEAVGLVPKIFVWGNQKGLAFSADAPFDVASGVEDLAAAVVDPSRGTPTPDLEEGMWARDWRTRFAAFAAEAGVRVDTT